jgi:histidine triad (HIT) family protein
MSRSASADCIFCKIAAQKVPCFTVYEDERTLAFADINPIANGHTLVISKAHAENLLEIDPVDLAAVHKASQKVAAGIMKALKPAGIAVLQLNGKGANQIVMHYHVHLIPRDRETDGLSILEWEGAPGDMGLIKSAAEKIREAV